jgi:glutathione S-transferase
MLRLYDREGSGNAYKVRLLLSFLDIVYEKIPVSMQDGRNCVDSVYLQLNPRGQIPAMVDGEVRLWGTTAILCYLAARYDRSKNWLPLKPAILGEVMQWLELAQNEIMTGLFRSRAIVKFGIAGNLAAAQHDAGRALSVLESRLGGKSWLAGNGPTIADIACFPYVALAEEGKVDSSSFAGIQDWIARIKSLDRFVTMPGI